MAYTSDDKTSVEQSENSPQLELLIDLAYALSQQNHFEEILRLVAQRTVVLLHGQTALIMMVNPQTRQTVKTVIREGREEQAPKYRVVQDQIIGWMMKFDQPLLSQNIKNDPRFAKVKFGELAIKSAAAVLIRIEGIVLGSLMVLNEHHDEAFDENDLSYLDKIAVIAAPYLRNVQKIQQYFLSPLPESALLSKYEKLGLLGKSKKFLQLLQTIEAAARCDVRVQLEGESGTGKERIARAIHKFSHRSDKPFVAIDCGAIPAHLIESELFGHTKGAFTGATSDRKGLLEEADNGTLFMDEIANLPMEVQSKFMRVLQDGEIRPVGSNKMRQINVRIISASSRSLQRLVEAQQFREDLFYRLHVYPVYVPSLNERGADIPVLANSFLRRFAQQQQKRAAYFSESLLEFFQQRKWAGNIRELENLIERLMALAPPETEVLDEEILPPDLKKEFKKLKIVPEDLHVAKSLTESLEEFEQQLIRKVLVEHNWNQSQAARVLKIPVPTLRYKMSKLGIVNPAQD